MKRLIVCLAWFAFGCTNAEGPPLVIGHVAPADDSVRAEAQKRGLELVVNDLGDKPDPALQSRPLVIRFASASSPEDYESHAVRLTALGRASALFGGTNLDETERLDRMRVPLFSFSSRHASSLSENTIVMGLDAEDESAAVVAWLKSKDISNATLVKARDGKSEPWATLLPQAWNKQWGNKAALAFADDHAMLDAETLIFAGPLTVDSPGWKQIGDRTKRIIVLGSETDAAALAKFRGPHRNVHWTTPFVLDPETKTTGDFLEKHQRAFGSVPSSDAVLAYDGLRFLLQSMRTTRVAQGGRLLKDLETAAFVGVTGPNRIENGRMRRRIYVVHAVDESSALDFRWLPETLEKEDRNKEGDRK
ncbi:MAG: hypothetical protein U0744_01675 [Gemmataceae bacterium]